MDFIISCQSEQIQRIKTQPLWVAHYGVNTTMQTGFINVVGHQYTETGLMDGVKGYCDVNNFNDNMLLENSNYVPNTSTVNYSFDSNSNIDINIYSQLQEELNRQGFGELDVD